MTIRDEEKRLLILAPSGSDSLNATRVLTAAGFQTSNCSGLSELCAAISVGGAMALVAEESLTRSDTPRLIEMLRQQEPWSDFPFIIITGQEWRERPSAVEILGERANIALLERPLTPATLVSTARTALRARQRQYEVRTLIREREAYVSSLQQNEERLRIAITTAHLGVWELDLSTQALSTSETCKRIYGVAANESLTQERLMESIHPDDRPAARQALTNSIASRKPYECEYRVLLRDGSIRRLVNSGTLIQPRNRKGAGKVVGVVLDITQRAEMEAERQRLLEAEKSARAEAEAANRMKDDFLATISHELRNPLNSILGFAQLLRRGNRSPEEIERALDIIERNSRAQASLINDLLDISRIVAGKIKLEVSRLDLSPLVKAAVDSNKLAADVKEISIECEFSPTPLLILGDSTRIQQIAWNLLSNAVKFSRRGGRIKVQTLLQGTTVLLRVIDNGIGIKKDFLPFVFDRFRQERQKINRSAMGLGLGLSIVRHLVELQGGTVQANSEGEGKGATFTISFPFSDSIPTAQDCAEQKAVEIPPYDELLVGASNLSGIKVLAVDDEADSRELLRTLLEECGATVCTAASVQEGLQRFAEFEPHVLVSDLGMPGEDGFDLISRIRGLPDSEGGCIPAIALTAFTRPEDKEKTLRFGFQEHLAKPVAANDLTRAIARLHRSGTPASAIQAGGT